MHEFAMLYVLMMRWEYVLCQYFTMVSLSYKLALQLCRDEYSYDLNLRLMGDGWITGSPVSRSGEFCAWAESRIPTPANV